MRTQPEPDLGQARARTATVSPQPGVSEERRHLNEGSGILSPSQLGVTSNLFGLFGAKRNDNVPFTGEPTRESLTMPPPGYQTPAANQAYGITDKDRVQQNDQVRIRRAFWRRASSDRRWRKVDCQLVTQDREHVSCGGARRTS